MRDEYHRQLNDLLDTLLSQADVVEEMLTDALRAVVHHDRDLADGVIARDNEVDGVYESVQHGLLRTMALQAPVASDLRLSTAMLHTNIHVERMGDYATSVAKMAKMSARYQDQPEVARQLEEMGRIALQVSEEAFRSLAQRDVELAWSLPETDRGVNQLNIGVFHRLVGLAGQDRDLLEWATRMILVARLVERWSDHAVDIGEQTIFVVTGKVVELSSNDPADRQQASA